MESIRQIISAIVLVAVYFLLDLPSPWNYFMPTIVATVASSLIGRLSLPFIVLVFTFLGPIMVLSTLFLITGTSWPGQAAEHLLADLPFESFVGILAPPFVGAVTWLAMRYLTLRSSGTAQKRAAP